MVERDFVFYLGTHHPGWLDRLALPLFVSRRRLEGYKRLPRAHCGWGLDSGGFSELSLHGSWALSARAYAGMVRRFMEGVGRLDFAAPQDWMCEPQIVRKTGLSVAEHVRRTVSNYRDLQQIAPDVPWMPVLQGWQRADYWRCLEQYACAGIDLCRAARVGVGTLCRRQGLALALDILAPLAALGLRLHGFGFKISGLRAGRAFLVSADSMAWSYQARRSAPLPGHQHRNCANCMQWAQQWYERVVRLPEQSYQYRLAIEEDEEDDEDRARWQWGPRTAHRHTHPDQRRADRGDGLG